MSNTIIPLLNAQQQGMSTRFLPKLRNMSLPKLLRKRIKNWIRLLTTRKRPWLTVTAEGKTNLRKIFSSAMKRKKMSKQALPIIIL